jgi:hypothetical protein
VLGERLLDRELEAFARERLARHDQVAVLPLGGAQEVASRVHPGLRGALGPPDPGQLRLVLHAAAADEELAVGLDVDPVRAEVVGDLERERRRNRRALEAEPPRRAENHLELDLVAVQALRVELVEPELLERQRLEVRRESVDPAQLERARDDAALAVALCIEERIWNRDRHLVPHLGRA